MPFSTKTARTKGLCSGISPMRAKIHPKTYTFRASTQFEKGRFCGILRGETRMIAKSAVVTSSYCTTFNRTVVMKNDKSQFVVHTSDFYLSLFICHNLPFVI